MGTGQASKIVEDLEKEVAEWEAKRRQAIESRDWQLSHLKSRDATEEERNAERAEILSRHTEISSNLATLIDSKQAQIKRAKADRDAIRDRD